MSPISALLRPLVIVVVFLSGPPLAPAQVTAVSDDTSCRCSATSGAAAEGDPEPSNAAGVGDATLRYVTSRYFAAVRIRPAALLKSPSARMMPIEFLQSLVMTHPAIDVAHVEEALLLLGLDWSAEPLYAVVCRFNQSYRRESLLEQLEPLAAKPRDGMPPVYRWPHTDGTHAVMPDDRTLIVAPEKELRDMLFSKHATAPLARHLRSIDSASALTFLCVMAPVRGLQTPLISGFLEAFGVPADEFVALAELLSVAELDLRLDGDAQLSLALKARDQGSVAELEEHLDRGLLAAAQLLDAEIGGESDGKEHPQIPSQLNNYYKKVVSQLAGAVERRHENDRLVLRIKGDVLLAAGVGAFAAEFLGDLLGDYEANVGGDPSSDDIERSRNNLKRIGEGLAAYQRLHNKLPQSSRDPNGKPLLSWRVHLLPFLGEQALYERFHLDEPWDSEHNRPLLSQMPGVYRGAEAEQAETTQYLLATGPAAVFSSDKTVSLDDLDLDGDTDTILVVEANSSRSVAWTRPDDFAFDLQDIFAGLGGFRTGGFLALLADGRTNFIYFFTAPDEVRELFRPKVKEASEE